MLNVGSGDRHSNGRGRILRDLRFEYLPIDEEETLRTNARVPTYSDLGFTEVEKPNKYVHLDPEFDTYTYGHAVRGFGDQLLFALQENGIRYLFFYATLENNDWAPYVIGYFSNMRSVDCRSLTRNEIFAFSSRGFAKNAHLKRKDPQVDLLIKGGKGSQLLGRALRLAERTDRSKLISPLRQVIRTSRGQSIVEGKPWHRWTMLCTNCSVLLGLIKDAQQSER